MFKRKLSLNKLVVFWNIVTLIIGTSYLGYLKFKSDPLVNARRATIHLHAVIETSSHEQFGISCSGVYINDNGVALTAKHCVEGPNYQEQVMVNVEPNGDQTLVKVLAVDPSADLAIIKVWNVGKTPYVKIAKHASVGDIVYAIGHPLDFPLTITKGIISNVDMEGYIVSDVLINPGSSGGPLVDEHGNLLGLTVAETVDEQLFGLVITKTGYAIILPFTEIKDFLSNYKNLPS